MTLLEGKKENENEKNENWNEKGFPKRSNLIRH